MNCYYGYVASPVGWIQIQANSQAIVAIGFVDETTHAESDNKLVTAAKQQITAYLDGTLQEFDLPMAAEGTEFQKRVWQALCNIPYGATASYQDIALQFGDANKVRAVGSANGRNPIAIVVPCHRVIGKNGSLTGYAGGLARKQFLLQLEQGSVQTQGQLL